MSRDERTFKVEIDNDEPRFWRAVQAVETAGLEAARQFDHACLIVVRIHHSTGKFTRNSVAEAKETAERNGFTPGHLWFEIYKEQRTPDGPTEYEPWIQINQKMVLNGFTVAVVLGTEVEVNGVFTMLQTAVSAALHVPAPTPGEPAATVAPLPDVWWKRCWTVATTHPMIVTIVGGLIVAGLIAWAGLS